MRIIIGSGLVLTILATFILMAVFKIDLERMSLGALIDVFPGFFQAPIYGGFLVSGGLAHPRCFRAD
jgi:hypothetical protein